MDCIFAGGITLACTMCGRTTSTTPAGEIAEALSVDEVYPSAKEKPPSFNVAPTQEIFVVAAHGDMRRLETMRWGLVPFFAKGLSGSARMINARAEVLVEKPAYHRAFRKRRCLIPFDGYYEWQKLESSKQPWYNKARPGISLAFAGLWEVWRNPELLDGEPPLLSCTIVTTAANPDVERQHNRMPLTLTSDEWERWLDTDGTDPPDAASLLRPPRTGLLDAHRVSTAVNSVRNDTPELIQPI